MSDSTTARSGTSVRYPDAMREREEALVRIRRRLDEGEALERESLVGVGLSGGGIRSATFCLGLFQGLAKLALLGRIDYLSTVSGGGYFGAFYGRLFNRPQIADLDDVHALLRPDLVPSVPADRFGRAKVFHFLRENGRYLAPRGAGDLILGGAVILRNWVSVQGVLFTFVLMLFALPQLLRAGVHIGVGDARWGTFENALAQTLPLGESYLWWSPYAGLAAALFVLAVVPLGWAYWMIRDPAPARRKRGASRIPVNVDPVIGLVFATALAAVGAWHWRGSPGALALLGFFATAGVVTFVIQLGFRGLDTDHAVAAARRRLSGMLKGALTVFAFVLAFSVVDTLGQTLYVLWHDPANKLSAVLTGLLGVLAAVGAGARRLAVLFGPREGARSRVSLRLVVWVAAALLYLAVLTVADALSHGLAWEFRMPAYAPAAIVDGGPANGCVENAARCGLDGLRTPALALLSLFAVSWLFGRSWPFLNRSSLHALYSSRLTRAYLGASNACRVDPQRARSWESCKREDAMRAGDAVTITNVIEGDDVELDDYYGLSSTSRVECRPFPKGAPLHIMNCTVNETIDGQSQIQRLDRKGFGLAVGPAGFSSGIRHHAVRSEGGGWEVYPAGSGQHQFRVFEQWNGGNTGEELQLGAWAGISGAA
ncbi:MAG: hypothetical protein R3286_06880, partial [Gammaproteobacteria bacterium]|nr:hypothetical protein [Gammaproteobacteria bacterium]